jgi:hypothetical protein
VSLIWRAATNELDVEVAGDGALSFLLVSRDDDTTIAASDQASAPDVLGVVDQLIVGD